MSRPALKFWGGKYYYLNEILPHIPQGKIFVDVFGGGGSVVQNHLTDNRVYNDLHPGLYTFFSILREEQSCKELIRILELSPYSREDHYLSMDWDQIPDPILSSVAFFTKIQQSFAGHGNQWSRDKKERPRGASGFQAAIENLSKVHRVWASIEIENLDWKECVKKYDSKETVFYFDPPYTCSSGDVYDYKFSRRDHQDLAHYIHKNMKGRSVLSGYNNKTYDSYQWKERLTWEGIENTSQKKIQEVLWIH